LLLSLFAVAANRRPQPALDWVPEGGVKTLGQFKDGPSMLRRRRQCNSNPRFSLGV